MKITEYRGFEIFFDEEKETFYATQADRPAYNSKGRSLLSAVKKNIDDFIKENSEFIPFEVMGNPNASYGSKKGILKIIGIRKDGRFIHEHKIKEGFFSKEQVSEYDEDKWMLIKPENEKKLASIAVLEIEVDVLKDKIKNIKEGLTVVTLKDIKPQYIQK